MREKANTLLDILPQILIEHFEKHKTPVMIDDYIKGKIKNKK